jgi:P4 family phage/plasmid primase-like protien
MAKRLARECLSAERMDGYGTWMEVGWCLHSIDSSLDMFQVWVDASAKSPKFSTADTWKMKQDWERNWNRGDMPNKLTLRSLHYWAKLDNPQRYKEITEDDIINKIQYYYDAVHTHVAQIMYDIFWENYKATSENKRSEWYEYKNHVWRKLQQGIEIRNHISLKVRDLVVAAQNRCRAGFSSFEGRELKESKEYKQFEQLMKFEKQLYNAGFKDSVMKECNGIFYEEDFAEKLNMNPYLVGCANGVLTLRNPDESAGVTFRSGKSEDYVSFQAGRNLPDLDAISYIPSDATHPMQLEIEEFFCKLFPAAELRTYMWKLLASCLEAKNREQCYYIWIGGGGNGKSKLVELMRMTLGDYVSSLKSTALTRRKADSGAANPELMAIRNKRFIYLQEPDENEPLNTSIMKQFSGEDIVEARGLFADQSKFKITGKLAMMCNKLPPINSMDRGTWRRIRVVPFVSKFVDATDPDINPARNIFPKDDRLDAKMVRWREFFLARLVHVYENEYSVHGMEPAPAIVMSASTQYKESFDAFAKFKNTCIRQGGKAVGSETTYVEFWRAYGSWYSDVGSGTKKMSQQDFEKRLSEELGDPEGAKKVFRHVRVFMSEEDSASWDMEE